MNQKLVVPNYSTITKRQKIPFPAPLGRNKTLIVLAIKNSVNTDGQALVFGSAAAGGGAVASSFAP